MTAPRIEIDLTKIRQNTRFLVDKLAAAGISVAGVTKAVCGDPGVAKAMLDGGASELADARVSNVDRMRTAGITCPFVMIRSPMQSEVRQIVKNCETSYNTEIDVIADLSAAALRAGKIHNIILMVEMGDMRDGILPKDLGRIASLVTEMPGVVLKGIGANFACLGNIAPDAGVMATFSKLANGIEGSVGSCVTEVSGGGSANLPWALGLGTKGRINQLRLGEAILLGTEPVSGIPIEGLHTDAFRLVVEVIETNFKPEILSLKLFDPGLVALRLAPDSSGKSRGVIAIGLQDTDVQGLTFPAEVLLVGATSDHAVVETTIKVLRVGDEIGCQMKYGALMRAMNARDVEKVYVHQNAISPMTVENPPHVNPTLV